MVSNLESLSVHHCCRKGDIPGNKDSPLEGVVVEVHQKKEEVVHIDASIVLEVPRWIVSETNIPVDHCRIVVPDTLNDWGHLEDSMNIVGTVADREEAGLLHLEDYCKADMHTIVLVAVKTDSLIEEMKCKVGLVSLL